MQRFTCFYCKVEVFPDNWGRGSDAAVWVDSTGDARCDQNQDWGDGYPEHDGIPVREEK